MDLAKVVIKEGNDFDYSTKGDIVEVHYTGWLYQEQAEDKKGREYNIRLALPWIYLTF